MRGGGFAWGALGRRPCLWCFVRPPQSTAGKTALPKAPVDVWVLTVLVAHNEKVND